MRRELIESTGGFTFDEGREVELEGPWELTECSVSPGNADSDYSRNGRRLLLAWAALAW